MSHDEANYPVRSETLERQRVFARGYDEVLSALKHQDDKLNRTLTAIAFLTAAGVTLFVTRPRVAVRFPEASTSIPAFFFVIFLASTVLALTLALAAIGPSAPYRGRGVSRPEDMRSLIFYVSIAKDDDWEDFRTASPEHLAGRLARNYHAEAKTIAKRTQYKVARSRESAAFVHLAILSLSLLGIFSVNVFALSARWWAAVAVLLAVLALPFVDLVNMKLFQFGHDPSAWPSYALLSAVWGVALLLLVLGETHDHHWVALYYSLAAVLVSRLALVGYTRRFAPAALGAVTTAGLATLFVVLV